MSSEMSSAVTAAVEHKRLERLLRICRELSDRLMFARALAAYALQTNRFELYLKRLEEYNLVERQLVIYRYLIGREWGRITSVRTPTLPPVIDVSAWV